MSGDESRAYARRLHDHSNTWEAQRIGATGTSFPTSPTTGDRFIRTDVRGSEEFEWDGTYWLSTTTYQAQVGDFVNVTVTGSGAWAVMPGDTEVYLDELDMVYLLNGGTHTSSHYWQIDHVETRRGNSSVLLTNGRWDTYTTHTGIVSRWMRNRQYPAQLLDTAGDADATPRLFGIVITKGGSPAGLYGSTLIKYRLRVT